MKQITFSQPDDWHVHFRDGILMQTVVPFTARSFGRAIVMPNLKEPITTSQMAAQYRKRIEACVPQDTTFKPLMTCYLTDKTDPKDLVHGHKESIFTAAKLYPAHATTNSSHGVSNIESIYPVLEAMEEHAIPLLTHGEVTHTNVDIFDREARFIETVLSPVLKKFPKLRVVMEHITTQEGAQFVLANKTRMGATITPQHLLYNRNALFQGGLRPHMYCLPILKREKHRLALRQAATSGESCYFLGTDTAPHLRHLKEADCGCAGVFSAPVAIAAYLQVFDEENKLEHFEGFASHHGAAFYGLPVSEHKVTYQNTPIDVPLTLDVPGEGSLVCLFSGEKALWKQIS